jgi:hypothetical protein
MPGVPLMHKSRERHYAFWKKDPKNRVLDAAIQWFKSGSFSGSTKGAFTAVRALGDFHRR